VVVQLAANVELTAGLALDVVRAAGATSASPEVKRRVAAFWSDPLATDGWREPLYARPIPCQRIGRAGDEQAPRIKLREGPAEGLALFELLRTGPHRLGALRAHLSGAQRVVLSRLARAGVVVPVTREAAMVTPSA
jgi:hypothetical protein